MAVAVSSSFGTPTTKTCRKSSELPSAGELSVMGGSAGIMSVPKPPCTLVTVLAIVGSPEWVDAKVSTFMPAHRLSLCNVACTRVYICMGLHVFLGVCLYAHERVGVGALASVPVRFFNVCVCALVSVLSCVCACICVCFTYLSSWSLPASSGCIAYAGSKS